MPATSVLVEDKSPGGPPSVQYSLEFASERVTVRDLISVYVRDRVERNNGTMLPKTANFEAEEERILNPARDKRPAPQFNCEVEVEKAFTAFSKNRFFVLIDAKQVGDLDEEITVTPRTKVTFLRLVPLVGG